MARPSRYQRLSLKAKTQLSLALIGCVILGTLVVSVIGARTISKNFNALLNVQSRLVLLMSRISDDLHRLSLAEYAYMINRDEKFLKSREKNQGDIQARIGQLKAIELDHVQTFLAGFEERYKIYASSYDQILLTLQVEGDAKSGLLGELRKVAHGVEAVLTNNKSQDKAAVTVFYLSIRRHEKDFLARRDITYLAKIDKEVEGLKGFLAKSQGFKATDKQVIIDGAVAYQEKLAKIAENYQSLLKLRQDQDEQLDGIESLVKVVSDEVEAHYADETQKIESIQNRVSITYAITVFFTLSFLLFLIGEFVKLSNRLAEVSRQIRASGQQNQVTATALHQTSSKTSGASTEQAAAIQETVSTLNEISAMVTRSVENAGAASKKAEMSHEIAMAGKGAVEKMRHAMATIRESLDQMIRQNEECNRQVHGIIGIIGKITEKTNVINDIVFQTKLLSFNASVESARAGEHGKGFAVVAEEVGVLARMSGDAAKEIHELLRTSNADIANIVSISSEKSHAFSQAGKTEVEIGVQIANECDEILSEVVEHVGTVKVLMAEVSAAAKEQSSGVNNITTAMNELDTTTGINADMAHQTMSFSDSLNKEARRLNAAVDELSDVVFGQGTRGVRRSPAIQPSRKPKLKVLPASDTLPESGDFGDEDDESDPSTHRSAS